MHEMGERQSIETEVVKPRGKIDGRRNDQGRWEGTREVAKKDKKPILEKGVASLSMRATVPLQVSLPRTLRNGVSESSPPSSFMQWGRGSQLYVTPQTNKVGAVIM